MLGDAQTDCRDPATDINMLFLSLHHQSHIQWQVKGASPGPAVLCTLMPFLDCFWVCFILKRNTVRACQFMDFSVWGLVHWNSVQLCLPWLLYVKLIPQNTQLDTHGTHTHSRVVMWLEYKKQSSDEDPSICRISLVKLPKGSSSLLANLVISQTQQKLRQTCLGLTK